MGKLRRDVRIRQLRASTDQNNVASTLGSSSRSKIFVALETAVNPHLPSMPLSELILTINGFVLAVEAEAVGRRPLFDEAVARLVKPQAYLSAAEVCTALWSFQKCGRITRPMMYTLRENVVLNHAQYSASQLTIVVKSIVESLERESRHAKRQYHGATLQTKMLPILDAMASSASLERLRTEVTAHDVTQLLVSLAHVCKPKGSSTACDGVASDGMNAPPSSSKPEALCRILRVLAERTESLILDLNHCSLVTSFVCLAELQYMPASLYSTYLREFQKISTSLNANDMCEIMHALRMLQEHLAQQPPYTFLVNFSKKLSHKLDGLEASYAAAVRLSVTAQTFHKLEFYEPFLWDSLERNAIRTIDAFDSRSLARLMVAFVGIEQTLLAELGHHTRAQLGTLPFQVKHGDSKHLRPKHHKDLFEAASVHALKILPTFNVKSLSTLLWAYAISQHLVGALYVGAGDWLSQPKQVADLRNPLTCSVHNLSQLAFSYTFNTLGHRPNPHPRLFGHVAAAAQERLDEFEPHELTVLLEGFARIHRRDVYKFAMPVPAGGNPDGTDQLLEWIPPANFLASGLKLKDLEKYRLDLFDNASSKMLALLRQEQFEAPTLKRALYTYWMLECAGIAYPEFFREAEEWAVRILPETGSSDLDEMIEIITLHKRVSVCLFFLFSICSLHSLMIT
jgi:hypothetical protein